MDSETYESWRWFLTFVADFVRAQQRTVTFVSDRHNGLVRSVKELFPDSPHCFCMNHLVSNVEKHYPGFMKPHMVKKLKDLAHCCVRDDFDVLVQEFRDEGGAWAKDFMDNLPRERYSIAWFDGQRWGEMTNNMSESFNSMIEDFRRMPIIEMLESLRVKVMSMMYEKRNASAKWHTILCPEMETVLKNTLAEGYHWRIFRSTGILFEVKANFNTFIVDIQQRTCSCLMWQHKGFPCSHALQALMHGGHKEAIYDYIEDYWKADFYRKSVDFAIYPVSDLDKPEMDLRTAPLKPPITKIPSGRPCVTRGKSGSEMKRSVTCSRCGLKGSHNRKRCKAVIGS